MMKVSVKVLAGLFLVLGLFSRTALAGPILADDGIVYIERDPTPLNTDPVTDPVGNPVGYIPYGGGGINMWDYDNNPLVTHTPNPSWWNAPGVAYTTTTSGIFLEFENLYVTGFTFNIGANMNARAWIRAYYEDDGGNTLTTGWESGIGPNSTPSFGVYVSDPAASCARITKIEVDPTFTWGVGNFGIQTSADPCAPVPEPQSSTLLALGMLMLAAGAYVQRRRQLVPVDAA